VNVDWRFARTVAGRVSGQEPFAQSYHVASLEADLYELTSQAEALVEAETGLVSAAGPARARVTDRLGWVDANLASFERLPATVVRGVVSTRTLAPGLLDRLARRYRGNEAVLLDIARNGALRPDRIKATYDKAVGWICADDPEHPPYRMSPFTRAKRPIGCSLCRRRAASVAAAEARAA